MLRVQYLFVSNNEDYKGPFSIRRNEVLKVAGLGVSNNGIVTSLGIRFFIFVHARNGDNY